VEDPLEPEPVGATVDERAGSVGGRATWYCVAGRSRCTAGYPAGALAAAVRADLLGHRGERARVCRADAPSRCVDVVIVDCNCGPEAGLIDLYGAAFERLAPLTLGRIEVTLTWLR